MLITVSTNFDLNKLDMDNLIEIWLHNSTRRIQDVARKWAPYESGKLKQGIAIEKSKDKARVWPRKIEYAVKREFENYKNPHTKYYMRRSYEAAPAIVNDEFEKAYNIVIKKIWA